MQGSTTGGKKEPKPETKKVVKAPVIRMNKNIINFDNNSTTLICQEAADEHAKWLRCFNPSSDSKFAKNEKLLLEKAQNYIRDFISAPDHQIVMTSGATESNCFALRSCVDAFRRMRKIKPNVIISATEHHSIIECAKKLQEDDHADIICLRPNIQGLIDPCSVTQYIRSDTCLVSIMHANNEIGCINNIYDIARRCHEKKVPFMTDCSQTMGKIQIACNRAGSELDIVTATAHKFYGPKGVGFIAISKRLIAGYKIEAQINGTQQGGLRGGTENIPGIASMIKALEHASRNREHKNEKLRRLCEVTMQEFKKHIPVVPMSLADATNPIEIRVIGPSNNLERLPNTLFLAFMKTGAPFCNVKFKKLIADKNIAVSIASACLTNQPTASHVLNAIRATPAIKEGVIRISFGDTNTIAEVKYFVKVCLHILTHSIPLKDIPEGTSKDASK